MTDRQHDSDSIERIAEEIRTQEIDEATAQRIIDQVWERFGAGRQDRRPLASCEDFQAEMPAYVAGRLSEARAMLIGDHTRECLACRRVLMAARGQVSPVVSRPSARGITRFARIPLRVAAAVLLLLGGVASYRLVGDLVADRNLNASIETVAGSLQIIDRISSRELAAGASIHSRQVLRTAKSSGAVLRLSDGSLIEMDERSELELRASRRGTTVNLSRGNIIVDAADQDSGYLRVATNDCEVAVKGTIFAVNHGLKGSRVSVIEGEVEVREGSASVLLHPGDQMTTGDRLRRVPLEEEIAWSRDAEKHKALLRELTVLRRVIADAVDHAPPRTSTFLLDLAPGDTFVYVAMPNISGDLEEARAAFYDRLTSSEVLAEWWQEQVAAHGIDREIDQLIDRLQPIGEAIGAEAVVTVPISVIADRGSPLFLADLDDPAGFSDLLDQLVQEANAEAGGHPTVRVVDDPRSVPTDTADLYLWVEDRLFAASGDFDALGELVRRIDDPSSRTFPDTTLYAQLNEIYASGASWLLGVDVAAAIAHGSTEISDEERAALERVGLLDASTIVIERHRDGDWYATNGEVRFSGVRRGMMAWLAEPAPMGGLDFVSPDAFVVVSAVTKDPAEMFDDLLDVISAGDSAAFEELRLFQERIGIDLREDFAATIGGEATFALDGPMLPVPSWKLIVEVEDPGTLLSTTEGTVQLINLELARQGQPQIVFESDEVSGRTFYALSRQGLDGKLFFTIFEGYLIAAPSRAIIDQAISYRSTGVTITSSSSFRALLPDNGFADCSALVYRDLGSLIDAVPPEMLGELEFADALSDGLSEGLVCVFGERDRISASATGGSLIGLASTLGICGAELAERNVIGGEKGTEAVSSL